MYKNAGDIILKHMCNIKEDHMMYGSWDIKAWWTEFFVMLGHFFPFDPSNNPKIKILKKNEKKGPEIL